MLISFVVPAKNEFPQIIWTVHSIIEHVPKNYEYEIILVDDASTDQTASFWEKGPARCRGLVRWGKMKIIRVSPENKTIGGKTGVGCWRARTIGFNEAKGDIVIFADAHVIPSGDTINRIVNLLKNDEVQLVHVPNATLGDDPTRPYKGYSYKLNLQKRFWGEYTNRKLRDTPYTIAMGGFSMCGAKRDYLQKLGLWHDGFIGAYSGGEQYIDLKTWLLGGKVWLDPNALVLHSTITRGYCFTNEGMWFNTLMASYCLGGEKWLEMVYKNMGVESYPNLKYFIDLVKKLGKSDREDVLKRQIYKDFDEMLKVNPWEFPIKGSRFTNIGDESLPDIIGEN